MSPVVHQRLVRVAAFGLTILALAFPSIPRARDLDLGICAELVQSEPNELESYRCYWAVARRGDPGGALRALEALLAVDPSNHRARLYLAAIEADLGNDRAEALYRESANGFSAEGHPTGEVYARLELFQFLVKEGRWSEADFELAQAAAAAEAGDDKILRARVSALQAYRAIGRGEYGEAYRLFRRAEDMAFPGGTVDIRSGILAGLGQVYWQLGLRERALEVYTRRAELLRGTGDRFAEVEARVSVAMASEALLGAGRIRKEEAVANVEDAVALAREAGNRFAEAQALLLLAQTSGQQEKAHEALEKALSIAKLVGHRRMKRDAERYLGYHLWSHHPDRRPQAMELIDGAIGDARAEGDLEGHASGLIGKAGLLQLTTDRKTWIEAYDRAIEAVESVRDLQPDGSVGARYFSSWAFAYHRYSGGLLTGLDASSDPDRDIALAFHVIERMRVRALLDEMDSARVRFQLQEGTPDQLRRGEVLEEIAAIQKQLARHSLEKSLRSERLATLEQLELEEATLRGAIARDDPAFAALRSPEMPTLDEVRERLAPDEAVLSYQLGTWTLPQHAEVQQGGSWVLVITKDRVDPIALPGAVEVEEAVTLFLGLCRRRDGSEGNAAMALHDLVLSDALESAGDEVRRLVIVPDGDLHRIPFAALRSRVTGVPLGARYEITQVPSVSLWSRLKAGGRGSAAPAVLALADPEASGTDGNDRTRSAPPWVEGLRLGSLPHARTEARRLARAVGGRSDVRSGAEASERFLKQADLREFGVLHFAAHAVVDYDHPDRSAVVLFPGSEEEDGFLQVREVVDLDLDGKVVVLSACRSASGTVFRGDGITGLARGFFLAGARAVVGSLWPVRDDQAETFMSEFYDRLARGMSLSEAMAGARTARIDAGAPTTAWAGFILMGDGDHVPFSGGAGTARRLPYFILAGSIVLITVLTLMAVRRRRA